MYPVTLISILVVVASWKSLVFTIQIRKPRYCPPQSNTHNLCVPFRICPSKIKKDIKSLPQLCNPKLSHNCIHADMREVGALIHV